MNSAMDDRVSVNTSDDINRRIEREMEARIRELANNSVGIERRLRELDKEWDIERMLEANASALTFAGAFLGASVDRRWIALPIVVGAFLFQHAVQGWCPPLPVLRRLGFRTAREIDTERVALKVLRGDFQEDPSRYSDARTLAEHALAVARL